MSAHTRWGCKAHRGERRARTQLQWTEQTHKRCPTVRTVSAPANLSTPPRSLFPFVQCSNGLQSAFKRQSAIQTQETIISYGASPFCVPCGRLRGCYFLLPEFGVPEKKGFERDQGQVRLRIELVGSCSPRAFAGARTVLRGQRSGSLFSMGRAGVEVTSQEGLGGG